ncbi:MAG: hypothetical protein NZ957_01835 [Thaumarchaeota archaeon]|nr:hypothetical protein [Candidatus Calditenuaceae archaeon]
MSSFIRLPPDSSGKRIRTVAKTVGGIEVHEQVVQALQADFFATYSAAVVGSTAAADRHHLVIFNGTGSGRIIRILKVVISCETTAAVTGYAMGFRLRRTATAGSGGTSITVATMDTTDPSLPSAITVWTNPTTAPTLSAVVTVAAINPEETGGHYTEVLYERGQGEKALTLREGEGITVQQYNNAGAGLINVYAIFTVE